MKLIGLTGAAGAGKDTAANFICRRYNFGRYAFAAPMKNALNAMFGFRPEQWDDREWKEGVLPHIGKSPRQLAQTLGTEWGRQLVNQDLWLILARQFIAEAAHQGLAGVVITDCRFPNEAHLIRDLGGVVVGVRRPNVEAVAAHSSEKGVGENRIDGNVWNTATIERLEESLEDLLAHLCVV